MNAASEDFLCNDWCEICGWKYFSLMLEEFCTYLENLKGRGII